MRDANKTMDEKCNGFSSQLRYLRISRQMTQTQLSEQLNGKNLAISDFELGHKEPCIADLIRLANLFEVSVDYLIGNTDKTEIISSKPDAFSNTILDTCSTFCTEDKEQLLFFIDFLKDRKEGKA